MEYCFCWITTIIYTLNKNSTDYFVKVQPQKLCQEIKYMGIPFSKKQTEQLYVCIYIYKWGTTNRLMILGHWGRHYGHGIILALVNALGLSWQYDREKDTHEVVNISFSFPIREDWTNDAVNDSSNSESYIFTDGSKGETGTKGGLFFVHRSQLQI